MKLIFFSDLHAHPWQEFSKPLKSGIPDRLQDCLNVLRGIREYAEQEGIQDVFFGGDLFHKRGVIFTGVFNLVVAELVEYQRRGITLYAVDGNHDHADKRGDVHAIEALREAGLVQAIPKGRGYQGWIVGDVLVTGFAYCDSRAEFARRIDEAGKEYMEDCLPWIGLFHHGFKGARVGSVLEYTVKEEIDGADLSGEKLFYSVDYGFTRIFSGHYHAHQTIQGLPFPGHYIGSPLEHTRSDVVQGEKKHQGLVLDTATMQTEPLYVTYKIPRFLTYTVDELGSTDLSEIEGNFVDVIGTDGPHLAPLLAGARGYKVRQAPSVDQTTGYQQDLPAWTPTEVLEWYLQNNKEALAQHKLSYATLLKLGQRMITGGEILR